MSGAALYVFIEVKDEVLGGYATSTKFALSKDIYDDLAVTPGSEWGDLDVFNEVMRRAFVSSDTLASDPSEIDTTVFSGWHQFLQTPSGKIFMKDKYYNQMLRTQLVARLMALYEIHQFPIDYKAEQREKNPAAYGPPLF